MPRHSIRSTVSKFDLTPILREPDALPAELTSQSLFGNDSPLEIEVGSGKGLFMQTVSGKQPESNFLGIEIARKYAVAAAARLARAERTNALMVPGNAEPLFADRIPDGSLAAVHVYFPDPWWKSRHKSRRVLNETFIANATRCLASGGRFHFWTDVLDYFESTIETMAIVSPQLGPPIPEEAAAAEHDLDYRTHFERRSRQHAIPVYRVCYHKP
ncbi:tRNA (guanosine(46)-N7)-methyltransferase TrmB [Roseimaritima ulvae]|uniref:tRNA (guanine-N(7)-)-methyltransferase n=1 Tax=Roseimaritima ulvae TaxID=980254 RepID=A0A5B9QRJ4_9BACT|nr:tRNA (guanosine(46)-N7)-methyltransferase TrmB [Roseimaritima ulvae]QEG40572.1 tRNA (guanine-N(7)-)-methyltransferase [Roseimaritima ulvae]